MNQFKKRIKNDKRITDSILVMQDSAYISREVSREKGAAEQLLRAKCKKEKLTRIEVITEWGDPRNWKQRKCNKS